MKNHTFGSFGFHGRQLVPEGSQVDRLLATMPAAASAIYHATKAREGDKSFEVRIGASNNPPAPGLTRMADGTWCRYPNGDRSNTPEAKRMRAVIEDSKRINAKTKPLARKPSAAAEHRREYLRLLAAEAECEAFAAAQGPEALQRTQMQAAERRLAAKVSEQKRLGLAKR